MSTQEILYTILSALFMALLTVALNEFKKWINTKIDNEHIKALLNSVADAATKATKATYQTYVENIKGTEQWTQETQKQALQNALNIAKQELTKEATQYIEENFGDLDSYLITLIESSLFDLKQEK